ncbi:serine protease inhibitor, putative [Pediculus humanus corporis]|uniref:Serine protease inhibitor, putative n=1 Tax=Pediculus humanus subsp. corporis TaxID=121224 RepID=E0W2L7_PEDHC|nr:serine protease inhibitor, putative [Pediculus humanus corporis]EEB19873.1 serine protease inhibitor, putative [Pediculus humanus corporis]
MKYALVFAFFAVFAIASAFPSENSEKEEETKSDLKKLDDAKVEETGAQAKSSVSDEERCEPGQSFAKECNTCTCPDSGLKSLAGCTLKLCL